MVDSETINEERLRLIGKRFARLDPIQSVRPFPREKPDRLVVHFYSSQYPDPITEVRLEIRLRLSGDFNAVYIEEWEGEQWRCRWDRHDNPHNSRDHFHIPPMIGEREAVDADYAGDMNQILGTILSFLDQRQQSLWDGPLTYPSEYEYCEDDSLGSENLL